MTRLQVTLALLLSIPGTAWACGVSGPDGVAACSLAEHEEATRPRWRLGASGVYTSTALRFSGATRAEQTRSALLATVAYQPSTRLSLHAGAGAELGGRLSLPDGDHTFDPGLHLQAGASWRALGGGPPFVVLTSLLSFSSARTTHPGQSSAAYQALDLRVGAIAGVTLWNALSPYATARLFGGPVFWRYAGASVSGTDVHHYQLGAGLSFSVARRLSVFAEGIPLGERAVSAGATLAI
jgi:opacity protein-like surface antigen